MTDSACVVVGNGSSLLDRENGRAIDDFANVARFNMYAIAGFERHVGARTDYWFNVCGAKQVAWRLQAPYKAIYLHSWQPTEEKDWVCHGFREAGVPYRKVDHSILEEMEEYAGRPGYRTWSTGAIAVWLMLKEFERVTLTGFDWWDRERHHYSDRAVRGNLHRPAVEKQFIDRLCLDGRAAFL